MKRRFFIIGSIILIFAIVGLVYSRWDAGKKESEELAAAGIIEVIEVEVSPKISERIEWLCCSEGDTAKKGDVLIRLDSRELAVKVTEGKALLTGAKARYEEAQANLENARARLDSVKAEIRVAESEVDRARVLFEEAGDNLHRISELFKEGYAAKKEMDAVKAVFDTTSAQFNAAAAKKTSAEAALSTAVAGLKGAEAQLNSAKAAIGEAAARLKLSETRLNDTVIFSPMDGVIAYKVFEAGEMASPGAAIYTIHNLQKVWARVDVEETDIGRIRLGDKAIVLSHALPDRRFEGEISEIGQEGGFATQRDVSRGRQDIRTFRVKVAVKESQGLLKPGMTVAVIFR